MEELRYPVFYRQNTYSSGYGFYVHGVDDGILIPDVSEVIAWAHMPNIYEEDADENNG